MGRLASFPVTAAETACRPRATGAALGGGRGPRQSPRGPVRQEASMIGRRGGDGARHGSGRGRRPRPGYLARAPDPPDRRLPGGRPVRRLARSSRHRWVHAWGRTWWSRTAPAAAPSGERDRRPRAGRRHHLDACRQRHPRLQPGALRPPALRPGPRLHRGRLHRALPALHRLPRRRAAPTSPRCSPPSRTRAATYGSPAVASRITWRIITGEAPLGPGRGARALSRRPGGDAGPARGQCRAGHDRHRDGAALHPGRPRACPRRAERPAHGRGARGARATGTRPRRSGLRLQGISVPRATPAPIVARLNAELVRAVASERCRAAPRTLGIQRMPERGPSSTPSSRPRTRCGGR